MLHFKYILHQIYRQFKVPYDELHAAPVLMSVTETAFLPVLLLMEKFSKRTMIFVPNLIFREAKVRRSA